MNNNYRYQLEKYRGRGTRYVCPQCGRKYTFTKYIDTYNNNIYINDRVGKCNRLDKCGYHYTPRQYFEDNPWKKDNAVALLQIIGKSNKATATPPPPPPRGYIPEWVFDESRRVWQEQRASDGTYFVVFPIRGSKFGAEDCGFSRQINFLSEWCSSGADTRNGGWDILERISHSPF